MRTNLQVPFAEKDEAKQLGARWDPKARVWYVKDAADLTPFAKWLTTSAQQPQPTSGAKPATHGRTQSPPVQNTGAGFFVLACDCLPWEGCAKCQEVVKKQGWGA
ncbi:MAG: hypothetical protein CVU19_16850 [Betaproteobacteria bacterium HGW-Betaproteobacteria-13]|jgi:hypothetical protein|nr:MAG: hypothetical protein CVU28_11730 [Betaproteobacteria bacterium HGW-Betaproteobacteria-21]PKO79632.1 MAG: hypothetical protein CVU19_16850 [Betaproteobacteria bacterium HGW-Betaproteobacteria-13]